MPLTSYKGLVVMPLTSYKGLVNVVLCYHFNQLQRFS